MFALRPYHRIEQVQETLYVKNILREGSTLSDGGYGRYVLDRYETYEALRKIIESLPVTCGRRSIALSQLDGPDASYFRQELGEMTFLVATMRWEPCYCHYLGCYAPRQPGEPDHDPRRY